MKRDYKKPVIVWWKKTGAEIVLAAADITTDKGRKLVIEKAGDADILVNNSGGALLGH